MSEELKSFENIKDFMEKNYKRSHVNTEIIFSVDGVHLLASDIEVILRAYASSDRYLISVLNRKIESLSASVVNVVQVDPMD